MLGTDVIVVSEYRSLELPSDAVLVCPALLQAVVGMWGEVPFTEMHIDVDTVPDRMAARILRIFAGKGDIHVFSNRWERAHAHDGDARQPCCTFIVEVDGDSESVIWEDSDGAAVHRAVALKAHEAAAPMYGCKGIVPASAAEALPAAPLIRRSWQSARARVVDAVEPKEPQVSRAADRDADSSGITGNPRRSRPAQRAAEEGSKPVKRTVGPRHQQRPSVRGRKAGSSSVFGRQRHSRPSVAALQREKGSQR